MSRAKFHPGGVQGSEQISLTCLTISAERVESASRIARRLGNRTCLTDAIA
jgi:predicted naringenin-chalcone synthase